VRARPEYHRPRTGHRLSVGCAGHRRVDPPARAGADLARRAGRAREGGAVTAPAGPTELAPPRAPVPRAGPLLQYALPAGPLLSMLDSSIVNVAVEPIARELRASLTVVQWTVSGY